MRDRGVLPQRDPAKNPRQIVRPHQAPAALQPGHRALRPHQDVIRRAVVMPDSAHRPQLDGAGSPGQYHKTGRGHQNAQQQRDRPPDPVVQPPPQVPAHDHLIGSTLNTSTIASHPRNGDVTSSGEGTAATAVLALLADGPQLRLRSQPMRSCAMRSLRLRPLPVRTFNTLSTRGAHRAPERRGTRATRETRTVGGDGGPRPPRRVPRRPRASRTTRLAAPPLRPAAYGGLPPERYPGTARHRLATVTPHRARAETAILPAIQS